MDPEVVATKACDELFTTLNSASCVDEYMQDQVINNNNNNNNNNNENKDNNKIIIYCIYLFSNFIEVYKTCYLSIHITNNFSIKKMILLIKTITNKNIIIK